VASIRLRRANRELGGLYRNRHIVDELIERVLVSGINQQHALY